MVQVPTAITVTVAPETLHTGVVCELKLTARPELAVAVTMNGALPQGCFESAPKVMVWLKAERRDGESSGAILSSAASE